MASSSSTPHLHANMDTRWNNRALVSLLWPLIIEQLLAVSVGMADTVMVASVGESAVSAVSLVDTINLLLHTAMAALATGGAVVASQYLGRRENKKASEAAQQLVYAVFALACLLMVATLLLRMPMLHAIFGHVEPAVMQNAETYLWISALGYPFIALYNAGAAIFRSMGNSRIGMLVAVFVNVVNIGGNALLIYGFGLGVAGAAIATLVSRILGAVILLCLLLSRNAGAITLAGLFRMRVKPAIIKQIMRIGIPNGLENSVFQIGKILLTRLVSVFGTTAIAANAVATSVTTFVVLPGQAFGLALLTVVGQCVGACDYKTARKITFKLVRAAFVVMAVLDVLMLFFHAPVVQFFQLSPESAQLANQLITMYCATSAFLWPVAFAFPSALRAAGDARFTMVVSMLSMWVFRIGFAYLFAMGLGLGVLGIWYAMLADWIVRATFFLLRWRGSRWEKHCLIDDRKKE